MSSSDTKPVTIHLKLVRAKSTKLRYWLMGSDDDGTKFDVKELRNMLRKSRQESYDLVSGE